MKYIHNYLDGSFCESPAFQSKVGSNNYIAIQDSVYEKLCKGEYLLDANNNITINPNYTEDNSL